MASERDTPNEPRPVGFGVDRPRGRRPGVPIQAPARPAPGVHWTALDRQAPVGDLPFLRPPTAAFGTVAPARGVSGWLRRRAYGIPDHRPSHWMLLLAADRVDAMGPSSPRVLAYGGIAAAALLGLSALRRG